MPTELIRQRTPEEEELLRKREELATVRASLAERELELADLRAELKSFEGRYLREVGVLYAELDEWEAKIAELEASLKPSAATKQRAQEARQRADETREATQSETAAAAVFKPSADLRSLFREAAKRLHPDFAKDDTDRQLRTRLMAEANEAYSRGDAEAIQHILDEFRDSPEAIKGEGVAEELVRLIRQIHLAKKNIATIERELSELRASEMALLMADAKSTALDGRDLLENLRGDLLAKIAMAAKRCNALSQK